VRLLPPALSSSDFYTTMGIKGVLYSYPNIYKPLEMMMWYQPPGVNADYELPSIYWEYTLYIGVIGTIFLIIFGLLLGLWYSFKANTPGRTFRKFLLPALFLFTLSIGKNYELLRSTGITIFYGERAVLRMIIVPFVLLIIFSAVNFQHWLNTKPRKFYVLLLLSSVVIFYQLIEHIVVWQVNNAREAFGKVSFGQVLRSLGSDLAGNSINNHSDPVYFTVLGVGLIITLFASALLIWQAQRVNSTLPGTAQN
jgi:hypothetical protein